MIEHLGHDEIAHEAKAPTCTEIGWNAYVTCSRCEYTTYSELGIIAHTEQIIEAIAPKCNKTGLEEGLKCSVCDVVLVADKTAKPVTPVNVKVTISEDAKKVEKVEFEERREEPKAAPEAPKGPIFANEYVNY